MNKYQSQSSPVDGCLLIASSVIVVATVSLIMNGWAASLLWGWFIAPVFDLEPLSIFQAIGLSCFVSLFKTTQSSKSDKTAIELIAEMFGLAVGGPLLIVFIGWIVTWFI